MEHKGISRSDERLIWCERESGGCQPKPPPSLPPPPLPFSSPPTPLSLPHSRLLLAPSSGLTVQCSAGSSWGTRPPSTHGHSPTPPPHPTSPSLLLLFPFFFLFCFYHHILRLWAVIPAVSIIQCLTPRGRGVCVCERRAQRTVDGGSSSSSSLPMQWCKPPPPRHWSNCPICRQLRSVRDSFTRSQIA